MGDEFFDVQSTCQFRIFMTGHGESSLSGDITGLLPITSMEHKDNEKGKVYLAHGTLRPFMSELLVSLSSSQHSYHTLGKEGNNGRS